MVVERLERRGMAAGKDRADVLVGVEPGLAQTIGWEQMARGRGRVGECETVTFDFRDGLDAGCGVRHQAGPICIGLAVRSTEGGDRFCLRHLMGEQYLSGPNSPISSLPFRIASISAL